MLDIPGYTIIKQIGQGGMAAVYFAVQETVNRPVALKVLSPNLLADPTFGKRFLREARISGQLDHPQIVNVYDVNQYETTYYICMEHFTGGDLKQKIDAHEITVDDAVQYTLSLAETLNHAHEKGFVHRDIKPANIMFRDNPLPVISDFGIARTMTSLTRMTTAGAVLGTPMYMSPEQTQGWDVDGRSDLYSLAIVFFEMLTGQCPFEAESAIAVGMKQLSETIPQMNPPFDVFQPFFNQAMAKAPDDRFSDGKMFAKALGNINHKHPGILMANRASFSRVATEPAKQSRRSGQTRNLLLLGLTALVVGGGVWWQQQTEISDKIPELLAEAPAKVDASLAVRLDGLLREAQQLEKQNALVDPVDNNALTTYLTILRLDADYSPAIDGLAALANHLNQSIDSELENENITNADKLVEQLAKADPTLADNAKKRIYKKRNQLKKRRIAEAEQQKALEARQHHQQRITLLLSTVDTVLAAPSLSLQELQTANDSLQQLFELEPNHPLAREKLRRVTDAFIELAAAQLAIQPTTAQSLTSAKNTLAFAATLLPSDNDQLLQLQSRYLQLTKGLEVRQQQQKKQRQEVANAIRQVKQLLQSTTLSLSDIQRAQNSLMVARARDPDATKGYDQQLSEAYIQLIAKLLNNNEFEGAQESVQSGLELFPNNRELVELEQQIKSAKKRQLRALPAF